MATLGVEVKAGQVWVDGKPFFMFSGELHYFRVPAKAWPARLKQAKRLGLNTIASYLPWCWHEPEEGKFDFTGRTHPERNVTAFIEMVADQGLKFFARPGPNVNAELLYDGLPAWLLKKPGGVSAENAAGEPYPAAWLPSFFKPDYQNAVANWYKAVMPFLEKYQASHAGPIIQVQLDNEIHMLNWLGQWADYSETTTRRYRQFLKNRYRTLVELNQAYQTHYADFSEIKQPAGLPEQEPLRALWDWALYYRNHYAGYYENLAGQARAHGLQTVLSANLAQFLEFNLCGRGWESPTMASVFRDFSEKVPEVVLGGATYVRHLDFDNFHDIVFSVASLRGIAGADAPVQCAEMQVGGINDRPRIYPSDVELNVKTAAAAGLNGINGYLTFGGHTPDEIQLRGHYHEWQAPVDSQGCLRDHAEPLQRFGKFIGSFGPLFSQTSTLQDLTLAFDPHYYYTDFLRGAFFDRVAAARHQQFFDGLARVLAVIGFNPDFLDLDKASQEAINARPRLWVFALDFMSRPIMEKLTAYVKNGGRLLLNPTLPQKDANLQPDPYLSRVWDLPIGRVRPFSEKNYYQFQGRKYAAENDMTLFEESTGLEVLLRNHENKPCAVRRRFERGEVSVIGFGLQHQFDYTLEHVRALAAALGAFPAVRKSTWEIHSLLRLNGDSGWLCAANFHDTPKAAAFEFSLGGGKLRKFPRRGTLRFPNRSAFFFPLNLALSEEIKVTEAECEVLAVKRIKQTGSHELAVRGLPGRETNLWFSGKTIARGQLDKTRLSVRVTGQGAHLVFTANGGIQKLRLN